MRATEAVQWVAVTTVDDGLGNTTTTDADPVSVDALVAARNSTESADADSPAVIVGKTLYLLDTDVLPGPSDRFTVRGEAYEVEGEAHLWSDKGVEVAVKRTGGRP